MKFANTSSEYGYASRTLHWLVVVGIVAQWLLAEVSEDAVKNAAALGPMTLHQSIGLILLMLAGLRIAWRWINPPPAWPADMRPYEIGVARTVHLAFYVLLFALPLTGWVLASVDDEPLRFFNWFAIPRIVIGSEDSLEEIHEALFNGLVVLALLHVAGAIKHWLAARRSAAHA